MVSPPPDRIRSRIHNSVSNKIITLNSAMSCCQKATVTKTPSTLSAKTTSRTLDGESDPSSLPPMIEPVMMFDTQPWLDLVQTLWSRPESVTIHTTILPPGMHPEDERLVNAEIVQERRYFYTPGMVPDVTSNPAPIFEVYVEPTLVPKGFVEMGLPNPFKATSLIKRHNV